jgi:integrase
MNMLNLPAKDLAKSIYGLRNMQQVMMIQAQKEGVPDSGLTRWAQNNWSLRVNPAGFMWDRLDDSERDRVIHKVEMIKDPNRRAAEMTKLRNSVELATRSGNHATLAVRRAKKGTPSTHPIRGDELRALRRLAREQEPKAAFVFTSERGAPFTTAGFARMVERAGAVAGFEFKAHPHMLRHACGFALANKGHDTRSLQAYLGHKNIQHTVRYTELSPDRFRDFWR